MLVKGDKETTIFFLTKEKVKLTWPKKIYQLVDELNPKQSQDRSFSDQQPPSYSAAAVFLPESAVQD